jgi:4-hydroxy 2-oxovalerate aldolase
MKRNIKILDCTLRDGGRIINCAFPEFHLDGIVSGLAEASIDIIELGFLRGNIEYSGNSTFFTEMEQVKRYIPIEKRNTMYVVFVDYGVEYGMWDFDKLAESDGNAVDGIRLGFRKKDFRSALDTMRFIQDKGYRLFAQTVESRDYSDRELAETIEELNRIKPYAVGIVDTFGAMYKNDLIRIFTLMDHNLDDEIAIDFHSHNNMQLSFSFAQEIVEMCGGRRKVFLDATLEGIGKGAGNLNTELIVDYLNRKHGYAYDLDRILDTIDEHIHWIKQDHDWGYNIPSFMAGIYSAHPNNVNYLTNMHKLQTKDIKYIISMIDAEKRKRYDYDNIDKLYLEYFDSKFDDYSNLNLLKKALSGRPVLVVVFGATLNQYREDILRIIRERNPIVISVNHIYKDKKPDFVFYGNARRYKNNLKVDLDIKNILTSNFRSEQNKDIVVNYNRLISRGLKNFDNSTIMLLHLLRILGVSEIMIAGFDGYERDSRRSFSDEIFYHNFAEGVDIDDINETLSAMLKNFANTLKNKTIVRFVTPSRFAHIFEE